MPMPVLDSRCLHRNTTPQGAGRGKRVNGGCTDGSWPSHGLDGGIVPQYTAASAEREMPVVNEGEECHGRSRAGAGWGTPVITWGGRHGERGAVA